MAEIGTRKPRGIIRKLDPGDRRNPSHPSHDEQWLELARELGRAVADRDWDRLHGTSGGGNEECRRILPLLDRPAKGSVD
jgi:hypothetical protein